MGDRSGLRAGHRNTSTDDCSNFSVTMCATWGRALSCWRMRSCSWTVGMTTGMIIWDRFPAELRLPLMITGTVLPFLHIPPQIFTEPPRYLSCSQMQASAYRSFAIRRTLTRPSPCRCICKIEAKSAFVCPHNTIPFWIPTEMIKTPLLPMTFVNWTAFYRCFDTLSVSAVQRIDFPTSR